MSPPVPPRTPQPTPQPQPAPAPRETPQPPSPPPAPAHQDGFIDHVQHLFQDAYQRARSLFSSADAPGPSESYASRLFGSSLGASRETDRG